MNKQEEIYELTKELLTDIELDRISGEKLLLKAKRLLRFRPDKDKNIEKWLNLELKGYNRSSFDKKYMTKTGRWENKEKKNAYRGPLAQIEAQIEAQKIKLKCFRTPDLSCDQAFIVNRDISSNINAIGNSISKLAGIKSRVLAMLHEYITEVYYTLTFEKVIDSIFETYKQQIDKTIISEANDVLEMLPSVMDRLQDKDKESISQALSTCRRIIDTFADFVFPPRDEQELAKGKVKNRINAYVDSKIESKSRKDRLRQNLNNLYTRVSTGVHDVVSTEEAKALVFNTYLLIGEILNLENAVISNESTE